MRRVWSWLLRSKVLTNKEYTDLIEAGEALRKDGEALRKNLAFWTKAYEDAHQILTQALSNQLIDRPAQLEDAQKNFEAALEGLRSEYRTIYQAWNQAMASDESLKKSAEELQSRISQQSR